MHRTAPTRSLRSVRACLVEAFSLQFAGTALLLAGSRWGSETTLVLMAGVGSLVAGQVLLCRMAYSLVRSHRPTLAVLP